MKRLLLCFAFVTFASCFDPVHDEEVAALGPEPPGVTEGPTHRAGAPCTVCHGGKGPGEPHWSVAGTVFLAWNSDAGANGAVVTVTDARGAEKKLTANAVGNFYVPKTEYDPVFPLRVTVAFEGRTEEMQSLIRGDAGCGNCHRLEGDTSHAPRIYVPGKGPTP